VKTQANDAENERQRVMMIGRNRSRAASIAAAELEYPSARFSDANSTIRIAFFAAARSAHQSD
jgi:hypothetical protein